MSNDLDIRSEDIFDPISGELILAGDLPRVAEVIESLRRHRDLLNASIAEFTAACVAESARQGTKTLNGSDWTIEVSADSETTWDTEELEKLLDAGLPEERYQQLVSVVVSYKVDGRVARQIESASAEYAAIIANARGSQPKRQYVKILRSKGAR